MLGALLFAAGIAPMVIVAIAFLASGETGLGLACAAVPWTALLGVLALKLPGIVRWLEMRAEKKQRARRAAQIEEERRERQARVRVSVDALEDTFDGKDALPEEAQESEVERRRGRG